jgi:hypothetical protein
MQPDPKDPLCCKIPVCTPQPGQTTPQFQTIRPQIHSGGIATRAPTPATNRPTNRPTLTPPTQQPSLTNTPYPLPTNPPTPSPQTVQPTTTRPPIYERKFHLTSALD